MNCCSDPRGCDQFFNRGFARRVARRYRKRGLDRTARRMVAFLERQGVRGASVLEVGGGVGEIQIELLKRGADRTLNLELSPAYEGEAAQLLRETGFEARGERRLHDIAVEPDAVVPADVVVLHRVVCCYPDYERLLGAAGARAQRLLVFSYPRRNVISRLLIGAQNLAFRIMGREFRAFVHPPASMLGVLGEQGLRPEFAHKGFAWQVTGLVR
jgi:methyltransferase family protein